MKKRLVSLLILFLISLTNSGIQAQNSSEFTRLSEDLVIHEIEKDTFIVIHSFPWPANSLLIKLSSEEFVLVDTPYENGASQLLHEWVLNKYGKVTLTVINTHFHSDSLGGNHYFINKGIPVYGSDETTKQLEAKGDELKSLLLGWLKNSQHRRYYQAIQKSELVGPSHSFNLDEGLVLNIGDERIELYFPGENHSPDNIVVYFSNRKILFGSCMIRALFSQKLGNLSDADVNKWKDSTQKILSKYKGSRIVIPGHGKWGDVRLISHTLELLKRS